MEDEPTHQRVKTRAAQVCAALNAAGVHYLVMGGTACVLHGYLRYTRDVDILIEKSRDNVERVLEALSAQGYGFASRLTADDILSQPITVIGDDPAVDLFWAGVDVNYRSAVPNALAVELDGVTVPLIGLDDLIRSKRTGRAQDTADIEALEQIRKLKAEG